MRLVKLRWWGSKYFIFLDLRQTFSNSSWLMLTLLGAERPRLQTGILITEISANIAENSPVSFLLFSTHFIVAPHQLCSRHRDWEALNKMTVTTHRIKQKPIENTIKTLFLCQRKWSSMKSVESKFSNKSMNNKLSLGLSSMYAQKRSKTP